MSEAKNNAFTHTVKPTGHRILLAEVDILNVQRSKSPKEWQLPSLRAFLSSALGPHDSSQTCLFLAP